MKNIMKDEAMQPSQSPPDASKPRVRRGVWIATVLLVLGLPLGLWMLHEVNKPDRVLFPGMLWEQFEVEGVYNDHGKFAVAYKGDDGTLHAFRLEPKEPPTILTDAGAKSSYIAREGWYPDNYTVYIHVHSPLEIKEGSPPVPLEPMPPPKKQ